MIIELTITRYTDEHKVDQRSFLLDEGKIRDNLLHLSTSAEMKYLLSCLSRGVTTGSLADTHGYNSLLDYEFEYNMIKGEGEPDAFFTQDVVDFTKCPPDSFL